MSDELVLYTNPMSRGRVARWMLEEVGAPYRAEILTYGAPMKAALRHLNPMGKVPVLVHGETVVTEVAAICLYLADAFPDAGLAPPPVARGAYYRWLLFAAGPLEHAITNRTLGVSLTPEQSGFVGYGSFDAAVDAIDAHLSHSPYVAGSAFTAADVYVGSQIGWGMHFGSIERHPVFEAYHTRVMERPAAKRAFATDEALMAEQATAR